MEHGIALPVRKRQYKKPCNPTARRWRQRVFEAEASEIHNPMPYRSYCIFSVP